MKRNIAKLICGVFACCIGLCLCSGLMDSFGAGDAEDPLITYSYVQKVILPELKTRMTSAAKKLFSGTSRADSLEETGDAAVDALSYSNIAAGVADELASSVTELSVPSVTGQRKVSIGERWGIVADPGATVLVMDGSLRAYPETVGSLIVVGEKTEKTGTATLSAGDYAVVSEKGNMVLISEGGAVVAVTGGVSFKTPLLGAVAIEGSPEYGETLVPDVSGATYGGTLSYSWSIDGTEVSSAGSYTVAAGDIGKKLVLTVTASGDGCGKLTSPAVTLTKTEGDAPSAPTLKSVTYNSVTLNSVSGMEYRMGTGSWQTSPVFSGLSEGTTYRFYMRRAETATSSASAASKALSVTTSIKAALTSSVYKVDTANSRMSGIAAGTTADTVKKNMDFPGYIKIYDASGKEVSGTTPVGTGWKVSLVVDGTVRSSVKLVVTGDVSGDGKATLTDFVQMKSHLLGTAKFTGLKLLAGDLNGDGSFSLTDFVNMKSYLLGNTKIKGQKV